MGISIKSFFKKIWKKLYKDDVLTDIEQLAFDIFEVLLYDEDNIRYLDSEFSKKYIVTKSYILNKEVNTFIIFNVMSNKITIVNHQYRYDISMPTRTCITMEKMFDIKVKEEREEMEKEILSNIAESLETVLSEFKKKLIKH